MFVLLRCAVVPTVMAYAPFPFYCLPDGDVGQFFDGAATCSAHNQAETKALHTLVLLLSQAFAIGGDEQALNPEAKRVMMEIMGKVTSYSTPDRITAMLLERLLRVDCLAPCVAAG